MDTLENLMQLPQAFSEQVEELRRQHEAIKAAAEKVFAGGEDVMGDIARDIRLALEIRSCLTS